MKDTTQTTWQPIDTCPEDMEILFLAGETLEDASAWFGIKDNGRFFGVDLISGDRNGKFDTLDDNGESDYDRFEGIVTLINLDVFKWMKLPT